MSASSSRRRSLVNLSVVAGSAAMFAVAWTGIGKAQSSLSQTSDVSTVTTTTSSSTLTGVSPATAQSNSGSTTGQPERVVVVRKSRAS